VDKAMAAAGEKLPVADAPALPADVSVAPLVETIKAAIVRTTTSENADLVAKAISNKKESLKLMGSSAQRSAPKNTTLAVKSNNASMVTKQSNASASAKPQAKNEKPDSIEFEKDFVDVDEDDEASRSPDKEEKLQTETTDIKEQSPKDHELFKLNSSIQKIHAHLAKAQTALENHRKIETGINSLANLQHGLAKKELMLSVKRQEDSIQELSKHIVRGQEVLLLKQKELKALTTLDVETSDFEIDAKTAVK
jgi:myosin heavy subunit